MISTAETYQSKLHTFEEAKENAANLAKLVRDAGAALAQWRHTVVQNSAARFPSEIEADATAPRVDAKEWPSVEILAAALVRYHDTLSDAREAWENLPLEERTGLVRPEV